MMMIWRKSTSGPKNPMIRIRKKSASGAERPYDEVSEEEYRHCRMTL